MVWHLVWHHLLNKPKEGEGERAGMFVYPDAVEAKAGVLSGACPCIYPSKR